jgi:hypothetical protein
MAYVQKNNPFPVTSCGRRRTFMTTDNPIKIFSPMKKADPPRTIGKGKNFNPVRKGGGEGGAAGGGMTKKGVAAYRRNNPGSKLQTAVTEKNPSKKNAARRKSFCARSKSWKSERGLAARRRWRC